MNAQRWEVRIVDSAEYIDSVTKIFVEANPEMVARESGFKNMFRNAPAIICVAAQPARFTATSWPSAGPMKRQTHVRGIPPR